MDPRYADEFFDLFGAPKPPIEANPRPVTPNEDPAVHPSSAPERSLVESLGAVADDLRQLYTDFGARPYRVFSVVYEWSGGEPGRGEARVVSEQEFLPTPVVSLKSSAKDAKAAGTVQTGSARLEQVSPRYTEDDINALFPTVLLGNQKAFIEVRMDSRDGTKVLRRRYTVRNTPQREALSFQWVVELYAQQEPRERSDDRVEPTYLYPPTNPRTEEAL